MDRDMDRLRPRFPRPARPRRRGRWPALETLERRLVLSGPDALDLGDAYLYRGERVPLGRALDQLIVGLRPDAPAGTVEALVAADGPLAGFHAARTGRSGVWQLTRPTPYPGDGAARLNALQAARAWASTQPGVDYASESFVVAGRDRLGVTRDLVVAVQPGVDPGTLFGGTTYAGFRPVRGTTDQFVVTTTVQPGPAVLSQAEALARDPRVRWAAPDFLAARQRMSLNDPLLAQQWHLINTGQNGGTPGADARVQGAWEVGATGAGVLVAIIDDGVQLDHPDLAPNLWTNPGETPDNGIDDDGNGYIDDVHGWDFIDNDADPSAEDGDFHGTAVAGVAVARGNNNLGVAGAAYGAQFMAVRLIGPALPVSAYAEAIYYAAGRTADGLGQWNAAVVLNESYGGFGAIDVEAEAFLWASTEARGGKGVFNFAATGNAGGITDPGPVSYPAGYPGAIAVGGTTERDVRVEYSQFGPHTFIVAPTGSFGFNDANGNPGIQNIVTTDRTGGTGYDGGDYTGLFATGFSGTSSATPLAAGVGALIVSVKPDITYEEMRQVLRETADKVGGVTYDANGFHEQYGYGRVNAAAAVERFAIRFELVAPTGLEENTPSGPLNLGQIVFGSTPTDIDDYSVSVDWGDGGPSSPATLNPLGGGRFAILTPSKEYAEGGNYAVTILLERPAGGTSSAIVSVNVASRPLSGTGVTASGLVEGQLFSGVIAEFVDTDPDPMTSDDYTVTILWLDDGTTSLGVVQALGGNAFEVLGEHVVGGGDSPVRVTVVGPGGVTTVIESLTIAQDSELESVGFDRSAVEGFPLTELPLAFFVDADPRRPPVSNYTALIDWGDGSPLEPGVIVVGTDQIGGQLRQGFYVYSSGTHAYDVPQPPAPADAPYPVTILIGQVTPNTNTTTATGQIVVSDAPILATPLSYVLTGQTFNNFLATFIDTDPRSNNPQFAADFTPARYRAEIDWDRNDADPTTEVVTVLINTDGGYLVRGQHGYRLSGLYTYALTIRDLVGRGPGTTVTGTIAVPPASLNIVISPPVAPVEGQAFTGAIARFTSTNPNALVEDYSATVIWGDGTTTPAAQIVPARDDQGNPIPATFDVLGGDKTYALVGTYPVSVTVRLANAGGGETSATAQSFVSVADAPLDATGLPLPDGLLTKTDLQGLIVASFVDRGLVSSVADFTATVAWGDGTTEPASIVPTGSHSYLVVGNHRFTRPGVLEPLVTITSRFGSVATASSLAVVEPRLTPVSGGLDPSAGPGASEGVTGQSQPLFRGTAEPGAIVTLFAAPSNGPASVIGTAVADPSGFWSTTSLVALPEGVYTVTASAVDSLGFPSSELVGLLPGAQGGPLIVDRTGPQVSRVVVSPSSGRILVTLTDSGSGLLQTALAQPGHYSLAVVGRRFNRNLPLTGLSLGPAQPGVGQTMTLSFGNLRRLNRGNYVFRMSGAGLTDRAGNPLDERFFIPFPGVYARPGQDFVAEFSTDGRQASPLRPFIPPGERSAARRFQERIARLRRR
ncbi:MAG: hypothetical protein KatS3mg108_3813 [Isosphaeraceae bacterium]|jgi:subtilisin family serine protease|nr:MAG: hypothetical protein KatS3mg108_3813 [Isosphaeraceae bacterium]